MCSYTTNLPGGIGKSLILFFCGGFGVEVENFICALLGGLGDRLGGESILSKSF